jgi:hypothetical protein
MMDQRVFIICILALPLGVWAQKDQRQDPSTLLREVVQKMKQQKGYRIEFESELKIPDSDSPRQKGTILVINPDTVYVNFEGTGKQRVVAIRKGKRILQRHPILEEWLPPEVMGEAGIGQGIQDPNHILEVLLRHAAGAKSKGDKELRFIEIRIKGKEVLDMLAEYGLDASTVEPERSNLVINLRIDGKKTLIKGFTIEARLMGASQKIKGKYLYYKAKAKIEDYNRPLKLDLPEGVKKRLGLAQ